MKPLLVQRFNFVACYFFSRVKFLLNWNGGINNFYFVELTAESNSNSLIKRDFRLNSFFKHGLGKAE